MARRSSSGRSRLPRSISLMRLDGTHSASPTCCWVMPWPVRSSRSLAPRSPEVPRPSPPLRMAMSARYASRAMNRLTQRMISSLPLALAGLPGGVVPDGLVVSQADDGDAAQRHVALPVAAFIEPVPVGSATMY